MKSADRVHCTGITWHKSRLVVIADTIIAISVYNSTWVWVHDCSLILYGWRYMLCQRAHWTYESETVIIWNMVAHRHLIRYLYKYMYYNNVYNVMYLCCSSRIETKQINISKCVLRLILQNFISLLLLFTQFYDAF